MALDLVETTRFGRWARTLPAAVIRGVLAASTGGTHHLFLRLAVDDDGDDKQLARSWDRAIQAIVDCSQYDSWGSKTRRTRMCKLAANARLLQAFQGTVANIDDPSDDMLSVLVTDGSAGSIDALILHVGKVKLERWNKLRTHARRTPALDALFAEVEGQLERRKATSPALALGPTIGLGEVAVLWFDASFSSDERAGSVARFQGHVKIDSRAARWFTVSLTDISGIVTRGTWKTTQFDHTAIDSDDLKVGRCDAADLPAWIARAARKLRITWTVPYLRTGLRGSTPAGSCPDRLPPRRSHSRCCVPARVCCGTWTPRAASRSPCSGRSPSY